MKCEQCELLRINGIVCHESGCPNKNARWIPQAECWYCGFDYDIETGCDCQEMETKTMTTRTKIIFKNDYHQTQTWTNAHVTEQGKIFLTWEQVRRIRRKLCPSKGCVCAHNDLGERGEPHQIIHRQYGVIEVLPNA